MVVTDPTDTSPMSGGGMFTATNSESRRVVPEDPRGRPTMKVVYVVLESQYQSSLTAAVKRINAGNDNMSVECVGYLLEELRNEDAFAQFKKDVEEANIFIGSLIFVQELAEKVVEVVKPNRENLDAVLVFPSMPEVMRLNKVGSFTMKNLGQSKSVVADFMKPGGVGEQLQRKLEEKASKSDNWLAEWWDDCAYFGFRAPVVINSSPGIAFPRENFKSDNDQLR